MLNPRPIDPAADKVLRAHIVDDKKTGKQKEMSEFHYNYLTKIYEHVSRDGGRIEDTKNYCEKIGFQRSMWYHIGITYYGTNSKFRQVLKWAYYAETQRQTLPEKDSTIPLIVNDPNDPNWGTNPQWDSGAEEED